MEKQKQKIVFYFRKNVLAKGDFTLYYCVANEIAENFDIDVFCVNNSYKEIQQEYLDSKINFCDLNESNRKDFEGAYFVTAYNQLFFLLEEIESIKSAKILLLFLHPQITNWMNNQLPKNANVKSIYKLLREKNAYGFMDCANLFALEKRTNICFEKRYFPVVFDDKHVSQHVDACDVVSDDEINIGWFGRLDADKIYSLLNVLDNLLEEGVCNVNFHLVGDGNAKKLINVNKYAPNIKIVFNSFMFGEERDSYLRSNVDMVVAMGISALDVALLSIPTVIPIVSSQKFRDDKLAYIFDVNDYCLGWNVNDVDAATKKTYGIKQIIDDLQNGRKKELGDKCYDYAQSTFNVKEHSFDLVKLITSTNLTVVDCLANVTIANQIRKFHLYKRLRGENRWYNDYLSFRVKLARFKEMNFTSQVKFALKKLLKKG